MLTYRYLLFGTDTDVGKTFVTAMLCRAFLRAGRRVTVCKPVETGASSQSDLDTIASACERDERLLVKSGMRYDLAAAPSTAARAAHVPAPSAAGIAELVRSAEAGADALIVETCGGALTPLSASAFVADIAHALPEYRSVIVAGLRLGVLSHVFGATEYFRSRGLRAPSIVLNDRYCANDAQYVESIKEDLRSRNLSVVACVPHGARQDGAYLNELIEM